MDGWMDFPHLTSTNMGRSKAGDTKNAFYLERKAGSCKGKGRPYNLWRSTFTVQRLALSPSTFLYALLSGGYGDLIKI